LGKLSKAFEKQNKASQKANSEKVLSFSRLQEPTSSNAHEKAADSEIPPEHKLDPILMCLHEPNSIWAEQIRILKTRLLFPKDGKVQKMLMVTSAMPGEGKSVVASNLAISIAQNVNEKVLLIDCDLRRPTVHKLFGYGRVTGLGDYLSHKTSLPEIFMNTPVDRLKIVTAGRSLKNATELITSPRMLELLSELRDRYSDWYVIIDAAPPAFAAEANALTRQTDGVLVVIKHGHTGRHLLSNIVNLVGKERIVGIVLNWFQKPFIASRGYHRYAAILPTIITRKRINLRIEVRFPECRAHSKQHRYRNNNCLAFAELISATFKKQLGLFFYLIFSII